MWRAKNGTAVRRGLCPGTKSLPKHDCAATAQTAKTMRTCKKADRHHAVPVGCLARDATYTAPTGAQATLLKHTIILFKHTAQSLTMPVVCRCGVRNKRTALGRRLSPQTQSPPAPGHLTHRLHRPCADAIPPVAKCSPGASAPAPTNQHRVF